MLTQFSTVALFFGFSLKNLQYRASSQCFKETAGIAGIVTFESVVSAEPVPNLEINGIPVSGH